MSAIFPADLPEKYRHHESLSFKCLDSIGRILVWRNFRLYFRPKKVGAADDDGQQQNNA